MNKQEILNKTNPFCIPDELITNGVKQDIEKWKQELKEQNLSTHFAKLKKPKFTLGLLLFFLDWATILLAFSACFINPLLLPLALLVAGSKQRALSNLIHDSSHWNLTRKKKINDLVTDLLAGIPMVSPVKSYRVSHLLHHLHLGHPVLDPDSLMHQRYKYNDLIPPYNEWSKNVLYLIFNHEAWKDSIIGSWNEISVTQRLSCLIWWIFFITIFSLISIQNAFLFLFFWFLTRGTGYHFVRTIAEFLDHSGLPVGSITKNSRLVVDHSWIFKKIFHPHNDSFHALHHFDPTLPNYNLHIAHSLIGTKINCYSSIKRNNGYFLGSKAAIKDLVSVT